MSLRLIPFSSPVYLSSRNTFSLSSISVRGRWREQGIGSHKSCSHLHTLNSISFEIVLFPMPHSGCSYTLILSQGISLNRFLKSLESRERLFRPNILRVMKGFHDPKWNGKLSRCFHFAFRIQVIKIKLNFPECVMRRDFSICCTILKYYSLSSFLFPFFFLFIEEEREEECDSNCRVTYMILLTYSFV